MILMFHIMKGAKIIRTSNWDAMTQFYAKLFGSSEREHDDKASLRIFADFGTEVQLEHVQNRVGHEVVGSLELYSIDPEGLAAHLTKKGFSITERTVGGHKELMLPDPDENILTIVRKPDQT